MDTDRSRARLAAPEDSRRAWRQRQEDPGRQEDKERRRNKEIGRGQDDLEDKLGQDPIKNC